MNPNTPRPLFGGIIPPFNLIPPSNPLSVSPTQPSQLLRHLRMSTTRAKTEVKQESEIKEEDKSEDRDDEGQVITI
jgi:hypothetical protein